MLGSKGASAEAFISDEEMNEVDRLTSYACETSKYFKAELLERLGSWELLSAVMSLLYKKILQHPETRAFFASTDKTKLMKHMAGFLSCALTGHLTFSPYELWSTHRHMLWHPHRSAGPGFDGARNGCPSADYPGDDRASGLASNSRRGVIASGFPATDYQVHSPEGDRPSGPQNGVTTNRCPLTKHQAESCPLPRPQGVVGAGWPAHAHQTSKNISCPLYTAFLGSAAQEDAAAAAGRDSVAAAAIACGRSADHRIDTAPDRKPMAASAQLCSPADPISQRFCSGKTSQSNDSSRDAESTRSGRPLASHARGRMSGSSSCSSISTGLRGDRVSPSTHGTRRSSTLSTGCSSSLLNGASSLSSSTSMGMVGLFTRGSSCRNEDNVVDVVGEEQADVEGRSLPVLGPRHIDVMTQLLKDTLVELDAKQELIDNMVRVISGTSHLFERGDIFMDAHVDEAKWQPVRGARVGATKEERLRRPFSNNGLQTRSALKSTDNTARLIKPRVSYESTVDCAKRAAVRTSQVEADPEQERARENLRNMFASW